MDEATNWRMMPPGVAPRCGGGPTPRDPAETIELLAPLVRPGGVIVTAAAESATDRWDALPVTELPTSSVSWSDSPVGLFASVNVLAPIPSSFPRRERKRRQSPSSDSMFHVEHGCVRPAGFMFHVKHSTINPGTLQGRAGQPG